MLEPSDSPWPSAIRTGLAALLVFVGFGVLLPLFPVWAKVFATSNTDVGLVTTAAAGVGLILGRPIAARLSEGRARRPTMVLGISLAALASMGFVFLDSFAGVMVMRTMQGLGFGVMTTASVSLITDLAPPGQRGQVLGYYGAANALSLLVGPLLGASIARVWGYDVAFWVAGGITALGMLCLIGVQEPAKARLPAGQYRLRDAWAVPALRTLVPGHFLAILLHGAVLAFLPLRMEHHGGWMSAELFFAIDAVALIGLRVGVGRRFDVIARLTFVRVGLGCLAVAGLLLGLGSGDVAWALAAVMYGLGFGAYMPAASALVGDVMPATHRARGFAVFLLGFDLALAMGGVVVGPIADFGGTGLALAVAAAGPLLAIGVYTRLNGRMLPGDEHAQVDVGVGADRRAEL
jgi:MFS family permease